MKVFKISNVFFLWILCLSTLKPMGVNNIKSLAKQGQTIVIGNISLIKSLPLPPEIKRFLNTLSVTNPQFKEIGKEQLVEGSLLINNAPVGVKIHFMPVYSLELSFPEGFKFSSIHADLKPFDRLQMTKSAFIISSGNYFDSGWKREIEMGLNFVAGLKITGEVEKLTRLVGTKMTEIVVAGTIPEEIIGAVFSVELPGRIDLIPVKGPKIAETVGLKLIVYITEDPSVGLATGIRLFVEGQKPIDMIGEIRVSGTELALEADYRGMLKNAYGIKGLDIGNIKLVIRTDYATAVATSGVLIISGGCVGGQVDVGDKSVSLNGCGELSESPDILLEGEFKGGLSLQDIALYAINFADKVKPIKNKSAVIKSVRTKVPPIALKKAKMYIAPRAIVLAGKVWPKGVTIVGEGQLLDTRVLFDVKVEETGAEAIYYLKSNIGPLTITGSGFDKKPNTKDDAAVLKLVLDPTRGSEGLQLFADGDLTLDVLKGLHGQGRVNFGPDSLYGSFQTNLFNEFGAMVEFGAQGVYKDPAAWTINAEFSQTGLKKIANLLANHLVSKAKNVQQPISSAQEKVNNLDAQLTKLKNQYADIEQKNLTNLQEAQEKLAPLKESKDDLDEAKRRCDDEKNILKKIPVCAEVAKLGIEFAAKQAAYEIAHTALEAAEKLQKTDPRLSGLKASIAALEVSKNSAVVALEVVKVSIAVSAQAGQAVGKIAQQGLAVINIEKFGFKANVAELMKGTLPEYTVVGTIAGKRITLEKLHLDPQNITNSITVIADAIFKQL